MATSIREALEARIGMTTEFNPKLIDVMLIDLGYTGVEPYTGTEEEKTQLKNAEIEILSIMSSLKSFSEGDLTITYDLNAINARLAVLNPPVATTPTNVIRNYNW